MIVETEKSIEKSFQVALVVDRDNIIKSVSSSWQAVAEQGGAGTSLQESNVVGQDLSRFIRSDSTRMYIEACLKVCRLKQQIIFREYRCDSPTHMRFMELQLTPLERGDVEMAHFLLREQAFEHPVNIEDVTPSPHHNSPIAYSYVRCSMCNSLKPVGADQWIKPESLGDQLVKQTPVIHSVCPGCLNKIWHKR